MKKGFTLIELLAVIVILAIIAVITVPKVAEMIDSSRKGASEDAFYGVVKASELAWTKALQLDPATQGTTCTFSEEGNSTCLNERIVLSTSGSNAKSGKVTISDNGDVIIYTEDSLLFNGYYCCGTSSKTYCKRGSIPDVSETGGVCKTATNSDVEDDGESDGCDHSHTTITNASSYYSGDKVCSECGAVVEEGTYIGDYTVTISTVLLDEVGWSIEAYSLDNGEKWIDFDTLSKNVDGEYVIENVYQIKFKVTVDNETFALCYGDTANQSIGWMSGSGKKGQTVETSNKVLSNSIHVHRSRSHLGGSVD